MEERIRENLDAVRARIASAASRAGRSPGSVVLLGATKGRSSEEIKEAIGCGLKVIGENRVQEFLGKYAEVGAGADWHFIGHLQRNKARHVVGKVKLIHSVDSMGLGVELSRRAEQAGLIQGVLLQVNVAGEESKHGVAVDEAESLLEQLECLPGVEVRGFSTVAPLVEDQEQVRWVFSGLRDLRDRLASGRYGGSLSELSMGMTNDFEVAIEEGSTIVRIGTAIFGPRT